MAFIRSLKYEGKGLGKGAELRLECILERRDIARHGWPSETNPRFKVDLRFADVSDLSIKQFGDGDTQITGFDIADLSDRGWDRVKYEVQDYENSRIHFFCADIEVMDVASI
ncbi:hypothetical protein [Thermopirellula anaerolimosa]